MRRAGFLFALGMLLASAVGAQDRNHPWRRGKPVRSKKQPRRVPSQFPRSRVNRWVDLKHDVDAFVGTGHRIVYDPAEQRLLLVGGSRNGATRARFYAYDGKRWTSLRADPGPCNRAWHAMAFDPKTASLVLFGGKRNRALGDTWIFRGGSWSRGPAGPPARYGTKMVYNADSGRMVLFGGTDGSRTFNDTWVFDPGTRKWSRLSPGRSPPARSHMMLTAVPQFGVYVFGGTDGSRDLNDTWLFADGDWSRVQTSGAPSPRREIEGVFDPETFLIVVYSGTSGKDKSQTWHRDTWVFFPPGRQWKNMNAVDPYGWARGSYGAAYFPPKKRVLVYGGSAVRTVPGFGTTGVVFHNTIAYEY